MKKVVLCILFLPIITSTGCSSDEKTPSIPSFVGNWSLEYAREYESIYSQDTIVQGNIVFALQENIEFPSGEDIQNPDFGIDIGFFYSLNENQVFSTGNLKIQIWRYFDIATESIGNIDTEIREGMTESSGEFWTLTKIE